MPIVVGLWDAQGDLQKATEQLAAVGTSKLITSAADAVTEISRLRQPMAQGVRSKPAASASVDQEAA